MIEAIESEFHGDLEVISQAAGLHVTVKWYQGISEHEWSRRAELENIIIRPFDFMSTVRVMLVIGVGRCWVLEISVCLR